MKKILLLLSVLALFTASAFSAYAEEPASGAAQEEAPVIVSVFTGMDIQPYIDEKGEDHMLDTEWIYYSDGSFEQYAYLYGQRVLFSTGTYSFANGGDFYFDPADETHGQLVLVRNAQYQAGKGLDEYSSNHAYDLQVQGFHQLYLNPDYEAAEKAKKEAAAKEAAERILENAPEDSAVEALSPDITEKKAAAAEGLETLAEADAEAPEEVTETEPEQETAEEETAEAETLAEAFGAEAQQTMNQIRNNLDMIAAMNTAEELNRVVAEKNGASGSITLMNGKDPSEPAVIMESEPAAEPETEPEVTEKKDEPEETEAAAEAALSGTCGEALTWAIDDIGVLTIDGEGAMEDYEEGKAPWSACADGITAVKVGDGVTAIGTNAFFGCAALRGATLPGSLTAVGNGAFENCDALKLVFFTGTRENWNAMEIGENNEALEREGIHIVG